MSTVVIWVDRKHAELFHLLPGATEKATFEASRVDHHTHRPDQFDAERGEHALYSDICAHLGTAERILIIGPGVAKHHFQTYLAEHAPTLAKRVVACETVDHPSDRQIASLARKFFSPLSGEEPGTPFPSPRRS